MSLPFDALLFFGAEGNGDLYAFRILAGRADDLHDVFVMVQHAVLMDAEGSVHVQL